MGILNPEIACQPVVIVGAPRSGTNMLRDILTQLDDVSTWPCDEINYIWRHGNVSHISDEFVREDATPQVKKYVRGKFKTIANEHKVDVIVEKTCANSLRIDFVDEILPEAKYIFICRDGIDAVGSAKIRWTAELDIKYILEKVKFVPISDLPYYGFRYFVNRLYRIFSNNKRLAFWGPKIKGMSVILDEHSLNEVCALQWERCVNKAEKFLDVMPEGKVIKVKYEDLISDPKVEIRRLVEFVGKSVGEEELVGFISDISASSIGKGRRQLGEQEVNTLTGLIGVTLARLGYENH
ncbi:MAG: sulfotransferase [Pseudomonadales bacterium]|nr:sulfotransferase [Pseudomonadales bacterium]